MTLLANSPGRLESRYSPTPSPCVTITGSEDVAARPADGRATWRRTRSDAALLSRRVGRPTRHLRHLRPRDSGRDVGAIRPSLSLAPRRRRGQRTTRERERRKRCRRAAAKVV